MTIFTNLRVAPQVVVTGAFRQGCQAGSRPVSPLNDPGIPLLGASRRNTDVAGQWQCGGADNGATIFFQ